MHDLGIQNGPMYPIKQEERKLSHQQAQAWEHGPEWISSPLDWSSQQACWGWEVCEAEGGRGSPQSNLPMIFSFLPVHAGIKHISLQETSPGPVPSPRQTVMDRMFVSPQIHILNLLPTMWWYMEAWPLGENRFRWGHDGGVPMMEWVRLSAEETKEISLLFSHTKK